jgi:D(-)-tartrate dehydratase
MRGRRYFPLRRSRDSVRGGTASLVAVVTDVVRAGKTVVGYSFASTGRFAQGGLIRERFAPRLVNAIPMR